MKLATCPRCGAYVLSGQHNGAALAVDPQPLADLDAYRGILVTGRTVWELRDSYGTVAARPAVPGPTLPANQLVAEHGCAVRSARPVVVEAPPVGPQCPPATPGPLRVGSGPMDVPGGAQTLTRAFCSGISSPPGPVKSATPALIDLGGSWNAAAQSADLTSRVITPDPSHAGLAAPASAHSAASPNVYTSGTAARSASPVGRYLPEKSDLLICEDCGESIDTQREQHIAIEWGAVIEWAAHILCRTQKSTTNG